MQPHIKTQPYEPSASLMMRVPLAFEPILLLANRVQLGGPMFPKETGVHR
jgi:hypothetical protein